MRIALDAMGGDHAPKETVRGALRAIAADDDIQVLLVGREDDIRAELTGESAESDRISVVHASDVVDCHESPVDALRRKKDSSIVVGLKQVAANEADAFISAGNTGAVVGGAQLMWRLIPGIRRAGIAVTLGSREHHSVLLDVGANISCKPHHLLHYGLMGSVFSERVLEHHNPRVGLLSIGSEDAKGNELVKETRDLFIEAPLNYVGHVEGTDVMGGVAADVIVCEGFVGNVVLKVCEGLSENLHSRFEEIIGAHVETTEDSKFTQLIGEFRKATDYAEIGGAPLLGVNGTCLIAHGRSDARAIGNGLLLAARFARARVVETIAEGMKALQSSE